MEGTVTGYRDFSGAFRQLGIPPESPVLVHASLSSFGNVRGGADTIVGALISSFSKVVAPVFTYKVMIIPEVGPPDNGIKYGSGKDTNRMAVFYTPDMPADRMMGVISEKIRQHPDARRSMHPILSFCGIGVDDILEAQTIEKPLAPIQILAREKGWVLLMGVDHKVNTSLHYAEFVAGRKQFIRWALTLTGIVQCPGFPGCSDGFEALAPELTAITRSVKIGPAQIHALPIPDMLEIAIRTLRENRLALLCDRTDCERCNAVRDSENLNDISEAE